MHEVQARTILSPKNGMNLYRGCSHGCIYCDSRSRCYHIDHEFEDIEVKSNALALLEKALKGKRSRCMIGTGSMTDPYIPLEKETGMTRGALEIIDRLGFGATMITKSDLVLRDLDLLRSINAKAKCVVQMTVTTADDDLCRIIEPCVCPTSSRFSVLGKLHEAGIPTVVWLCPILPFINDTPENITAIVEGCRDAGVKGIICFGMGMTLREGNREYFYENLDRHFPGLRSKYMFRYGDSYMVSSPRNRELMRLFSSLCDRYGIMHDNDGIFAYLNELEPEKRPVQTDLLSF